MQNYKFFIIMNFKTTIPLVVFIIIIGISITYGVILMKSNVTLNQTAKLEASDAAANDHFGSSVSISADGTVALIGSVDDDTDSVYDTGSAYIFENNDGKWIQTAKLIASDVKSADHFGSSVSISADGTVALIGSFYDDTDSVYDTGSAYIFENNDGKWTQTAKLEASDAAANDYFGSSVSISADGTVALIGSFYDDTDSVYDTGSAYIFENNDGKWIQTAKLIASDVKSADHFGSSVSISADGTVALIGSFYDDTDSVYDTGSAYIFENNDDQWTQIAKLEASDAAANDYFGSSVSISADGVIALLGSRVDDASAGAGIGSAYVLKIIILCGHTQQIWRHQM